MRPSATVMGTSLNVALIGRMCRHACTLPCRCSWQESVFTNGWMTITVRSANTRVHAASHSCGECAACTATKPMLSHPVLLSEKTRTCGAHSSSHLCAALHAIMSSASPSSRALIAALQIATNCLRPSRLSG